MSARTPRTKDRYIRSPFDLPPGYELMTHPYPGQAFQEACARAPVQGAGTIVWVPRADLVEFALILEPGQPLSEARFVHYAIMNAIGDVITRSGAGDTEIAFAWPNAIICRTSFETIAGTSLAWPLETPEDAVPSWMVAGIAVRAIKSDHDDLPSAATVLNGFTRSFLVHLNRWEEQGIKALAAEFERRLASTDSRKPTDRIDLGGNLTVAAAPPVGAPADRRSLAAEPLRHPLLEPRSNEARCG